MGPTAFLNNLGENAFAPPPGSPPPPLIADGRAFFPSDQPPTLPPFDGTNHGNGFFATPLTAIGTITSEGLEATDDLGVTRPLDPAGWDHFA